MRHNRFMAAIQGIDIDKEDKQVDKVAELKQKLAAKASGKSEDHYEMELFGFGVEIEE